VIDPLLNINIERGTNGFEEECRNRTFGETTIEKSNELN